MKRIALFMLVLIAGAAVAAYRQNGTVEGHLDIGPLRPVQRPGQEPKVPPEMYKRYRVEFQLLQNGPTTVVPVDGRGNFTANLAPGRYRVSVPAKGVVPVPPPAQVVTVLSGKTLKLKIKVDTGIR
jgi:hypothetical protein